MLVKILGYSWMFMGVVFLIKPEWLMKSLHKKGRKKIRAIFMAVGLVLGGLLIGATWGRTGILPLCLLIIGIIAIIKGLFLGMSSASDKLLNWLEQQNVNLFRVGAAAQIILGYLILRLL